VALQTPSRPSGDVPTREQIAIEDTWDLTTLYSTDNDWERDLARVPELLNAVTGHAGHMGESPARLRQAIDDMMALHFTLEREGV
jgi:oligoendopeptidase F